MKQINNIQVKAGFGRSAHKAGAKNAGFSW
jgi:hypothetical protein